MESKRVLIAYGTRPEAIKTAPVVRALWASESIQPVVVVSGEDREGVAEVNELFSVVPDSDLNIADPGSSRVQATTQALERYSAFIDHESIDAVVVQGDTTTAVAAAMAGFYAERPVVHIEAGLRTGNRHAPYPEEINRRLITELATLHLAPTPRSRDNLVAGGVLEPEIAVTGNPVVDALLFAAGESQPVGDPVIDEAPGLGRQIVLVTAHRRESWGDGLDSIGRAAARIAQSRPDVLLVMPIHRNPAVRRHLLPPVQDATNVRVIEPLPYGRFARLLAMSTLVLTDSGGVEEEAPSLGIPVLVMRDTTERPEGITARAAKLVGTRASDIVDQALDLLDNEFAYERMASAGNPYGDGKAGARSRAAVEHLLGLGERLADFTGEWVPPIPVASDGVFEPNPDVGVGHATAPAIAV